MVKDLAVFLYIPSNPASDEEVDKEAFRYPSQPFTKEQTIPDDGRLGRSSFKKLEEYTEESISDLSTKIIDSQVQGRILQECPITFKDIAK